MPTKTDRIMTWAMLALVAMAAGSTTYAAKVAMRLHELDAQYTEHPDSYPVCKSKLDFMHWDGNPNPTKNALFNTRTALLATPLNSVGTYYTGAEVVARIRGYEDNGWEVYGCWLFREDWINTDTPGGDYPADWRILSTNEIANIRNAIANANPPLRCKDTVKLFQLLTKAGTAGKFPYLEEEIINRFKSLDGLGVEVHIGDHESRKDWLTGMAMISRWAEDNDKTTFVFMGGGSGSYENLPYAQKTYQYLWSEMLNLGIDYRADNIIYFRQGAWPDGRHTPESEDTLTHQQRWIINTVAPNGTSLFVGDVWNLTINADTTATVPFIVGKAETTADQLTVSAISSDQSLVPNANLRISGRGTDRVLSATPLAAQTGTTTITLMAEDGVTNMTSSFQLTVAPANVITAVATGPIDATNTWGTALPVAGDVNVWRTGTQTLNMAATNKVAFLGGTLEVSSGGQILPGVPGARLALNKLVLNGGTIRMGNNLSFNLDLGNQQFALNSGSLKAGGGMTVRFDNAVLAGSGTIDIASTGSSAANVEFHNSSRTMGFTGRFNVSANGVLDLPPVPVDNASFGLNLSGTGKYANDADVALTSLVISGANIPPGTYAYTDFTPTQRAFLASTNGVITVISNTPPTMGAIMDATIDENSSTNLAFTVGDAQTSSGSLAVSGFSSNPALVPHANLVFGGSGSNRTVTITPAPNQSGTATITLAVDDGWFKTVRTFVLTVTHDPNSDIDSDGDGLTNADELLLGRNPASASDLAFEFNTDGSFDGWGGFANITNRSVGGGSIKGTSVTGDPQLSREGFLFDSAAVPSVIVKLKASAAGQAQFFWGNSATPGFAASRRIDLPYTAANAWQAIIVPLAGHAEWDGKTIVNLRIDPIGVGGATFEIDWIRASDGDLDNDGIPDSSEDVNHIDVPIDAYEQWAEAHSVAGTKADDDDDDGLLNLAEYALGGNPTNPADRGHAPAVGTGSNWFEYVHVKRSAPNSGVTSTVETADDLVSPAWTTNGISIIGTGVLDADFNTVTNRISTEAKNERFIRLLIE